MSVTVVVCGLVRRPDLFRLQLEALGQALRAGQVNAIYYSTWIGEIDQYEGLRHDLAQVGATLIEAPQPVGYAGPGHVYLQTATFRRALALLDPDQVVLRLRPDIVFPHRVNLDGLFPYLDSAIPALENPLAGLSGRIFTGAFNSIHPFWLEDRYMAGKASDLLKLSTLSLDYDHFAHRGAAIAEVRWYARPFVDVYRSAMDALRVNWNARQGTGEGTRGSAFDGVIEGNADLQRLLATYHFILKRSFLIGVPPDVLKPDDYAQAPEPKPADDKVLPWIINNHIHRAAYAERLAELDADDARLQDPLIDEDALRRDLLKAGSALWAQPKIGLADDADKPVAPDSPAYLERIAFGAASHASTAQSRGGLWVSLAWSNTNTLLRFGDAPPRVAFTWHRAGAQVLAGDWMSIPNIDRPVGEEDLLTTVPQKPGRYELQVRLVVENVGWHPDIVRIPIDVVR
jgi:hypothetical protein